MVKHKLVSFVAVVALWTHEILLIELIRINSSSGNRYKKKIMPFWPLCCDKVAYRATLICHENGAFRIRFTNLRNFKRHLYLSSLVPF